jgi:hypothetical protein
MGVMELRSADERVVYNRNGHLLVSVYIDDGVEDFTGHFSHIARVDLDEWRKHWKEEPSTELDILDLAHWFRNADEEKEIYHPADQNWRAEVAGMKNKKFT